LECNSHTVTLHNKWNANPYYSFQHCGYFIYTYFFEVHLLCFIMPSETLVKSDVVVQGSWTYLPFSYNMFTDLQFLFLLSNIFPIWFYSMATYFQSISFTLGCLEKIIRFWKMRFKFLKFSPRPAWKLIRGKYF
jgi:hypothetical protein